MFKILYFYLIYKKTQFCLSQNHAYFNALNLQYVFAICFNFYHVLNKKQNLLYIVYTNLTQQRKRETFFFQKNIKFYKTMLCNYVIKTIFICTKML